MKNNKIFGRALISISLIVFFICLSMGCAGRKASLLGWPSEPEERLIDKVVSRKAAKKIGKRYEGSLWPGANSRNMLSADNKARGVGDIVTIKIVESSTATKKATTKTGRKSDLSTSVSDLLGLPSTDLGLGKLVNLSGNAFGPSIGTKIDNSFEGTGTTTRSGKLTASITALITEEFSNGNLMIEGKRSVKVNNEAQIIVISGIIRPEDIEYDNTILSTYIADARITYTGKGVIADKQRVGWFVRILDLVWP
ncbi:MAG: flagellar basal body L-ring protein FlgH, partial [Nitrospinota bacterium]